MKLPNRFKIGGSVYKIISQQLDTLWGIVRISDRVISISDGINHDLAQSTLLHEIIHIVAERAGFGDLDEKIVNALAYGITDAMKQNSWWASFFCSKTR